MENYTRIILPSVGYSEDSNVDSNVDSNSVLEELIIKAADEFQSIEDIAIKIKKSKKYLMNKILPKMLENDKLQRLYPNTPKHPGQKYKIK